VDWRPLGVEKFAKNPAKALSLASGRGLGEGAGPAMRSSTATASKSFLVLFFKKEHSFLPNPLPVKRVF
jgi:hypothetical protein